MVSTHIVCLRLSKHICHSCQAWGSSSDYSWLLIYAHVLLHHGRPRLGLWSLDLALLVDTDTFDTTQEIEHDAALHTFVRPVGVAELCKSAIDTVLVTHAG